MLAAAKANSDMIVDAHVAAVAVEAGGGVVITGDEKDLVRLCAPYRNISVEAV
ncbi:MAG: hypothetical protein ACRDP8_13270 [Actinopolymorphaceae bacterium]